MPFDSTAHIKKWQSQLLDRSKRNQLISFKTDRGDIALIYPDPGEFWCPLVASGSTLTFVWKRDLIDLPGDSEESEREAMSSEPLFSQEILNRCRHSPRTGRASTSARRRWGRPGTWYQSKGRTDARLPVAAALRL
jgi:hypothetical protein